MASSLFYTSYAAPELCSNDALGLHGLEVIEDDVDTAWSRWDAALTQEQASKLGLGTIGQPMKCFNGIASERLGWGGEVTQPMALEDLSLEQRKSRALIVIEEHHPRIAKSIRTLWGYSECILFVNKLILEGHDPEGRSRAGFSQMAVQAMLALTEVHEAIFGNVETARFKQSYS